MSENSDSITYYTPREVTNKSLKGVLALGVRQILVQGINLIGSAILARLLSPSEFGIYSIITFVLNFLMVFGDIGLGASLLRQVDDPQKEDYQAVFTFQQVVVIIVVGIFWIVSPIITNIYNLPLREIWSFRLLVLALFFTSLRVVPSITLGRSLAFDKLAIAEVGQAIVFNASVILSAISGAGAMSFSIALALRSMVGTILLTVMNPWQFKVLWDWSRVKRHLRFGLPYQGIGVIALIKDSITPIFIGALLGMAQVGYINWALMVAAYPVWALRLFSRIYLPAFSRMQTHNQHLSSFIELAIKINNMIVAPLAVFTLVLLVPLTSLVFGEKWLVALPLFYFIWVANLFVPTIMPLMELLNALGHSRITLGFSVMWMVGTWIFGVPLIILYGGLGFAVANLLVQFTNFLVYRIAQSKVHFRIWSLIWRMWVLAGGIGMIMYGLQTLFPPVNLVELGLYGLIGGVVYAIGLWFLYPEDAQKLRSHIGTGKWETLFQW